MTTNIINSDSKWWYRHTILPVTFTILIIYFDTFNHYWFLKLIGGYTIKVWLLPFFLFFFFLVRKFLQGNLNFPRKNINLLNTILSFYVLSGFGALLIHEEPWNIGKYSLIMFGPVLLYMSIIYAFRNNEDIEKTVQLLYLLGLMYAVYVFYLFFFVGPEAWELPALQRKFMLTDYAAELNPLNFNTFFIGETKGRVIRTAIPGIPEPRFGGMLGPLSLVGFYLALNARRYLKIFYYVSSMLLVFAVIATLARSSVVALLIGIAIFILSLRNKLKGMLFGLSICVLTIVVLMFTKGAIDRIIQLLSSINILMNIEFINNLVIERGIYVREEGHVAGFMEGIKAVTKAPFFNILGVGVQNFEDMYANNRWAAPHNRYLYILDTVGFMTLIPYLAFIVILILKTRRTFLHKLKDSSAKYNLGHILYPSVILLFIKINNEGMEMYYYWIVFALAAAWIRNCAYEQK